MGFLDSVLGATSALSSQSQGAENPALAAVLQFASNPQNGGLSGIIESFERGGLGDVAKSWVSTGENLPITEEQIHSVLGSEQVSSIASALGVDPAQAASHLAQYLPQVINSLTPGGDVAHGDDLLAQGMDLLKSKFFA
jgi:uncharacterized protein YidB (DUF937 family)